MRTKTPATSKKQNPSIKSTFGFKFRAFASLLVVTFVMQEMAFAAPDLAGLPAFGGKPEIRFKLAPSVAEIEDSYKAPSGSGQKTVILIQDAHTNESGQLNIARALDTILRAENIQHVYLEAGTGDASLSDLRDKAPLAHRKAVSLSYLRKGLLQGSEYLDVTSDLDFNLWGVEDPVLYEKALVSYRALVERRETVSVFLTKMENTLPFAPLSASILPPCSSIRHLAMKRPSPVPCLAEGYSRRPELSL